MHIIFELLGIEVFFAIVNTFWRCNPQLCISMYLFNKPICYLVIFVFEYFVGSFLVIFFIVF